MEKNEYLTVKKNCSVKIKKFSNLIGYNFVVSRDLYYRCFYKFRTIVEYR